MTAASVRVFAALELPASVRQQLSAVSDGLRAALPPGSVRWVRPDGLHLTLQFYGEVDRARLPGLEAALAAAAATTGPLTLTLAGLGAFPNPARARVVWVGLAGDVDALRQLHAAVAAGGRTLGFPPDARGFNPHLTLGRVNQPLRPLDQRKIVDALAAARVPSGAPFRLEAVSLVRSDLRPGGAVYTTLRAAPLAGR